MAVHAFNMIDKEYRLKLTERTKKIVEGLTIEEKVSLMSGEVPIKEMLQNYNYLPYSAGGIEEKSIPPMKFCDGSRGVVCGVGKNTCFPVSMLRGASFDTYLEERVGHTIGKEVRAWGGNLFAGVCINLPYHPGWGRSQETYGEDSYHLGQMGSALVRGVQKENVIACVKHFAFNSMENSRFKVNIECDKRTEREVFLPHFKECIDNGAAAIMSSYNLYKGKHCGQNRYLLDEVLKNEWDFDGFVMSDFVWGITDTVEAGNSGQNMEMCNTNLYGQNLVDAVKEGKVSEEKVTESAIRIIRTLLAFTEVDNKDYSKELLGCKEHVALALEVAEKGITLIQNNNHVLPIDRDKVESIVILGKLANQGNIGDNGSSQVFPEYIVSPLQGIAAVSRNKKVIFNDGSDLNHAKELAERADYVVFVVGYDCNDEGEYVSSNPEDIYADSIGGDRRKSLGLHEDEIELIKEVGPVNSNSVAVLIGGNMIMIEEWKEYVNAIMMAYYPGMEGGTAIGKILFGDVNPSGKLPFVITKKETDLPQVNWDTESQKFNYYHGYTKLDKEQKKPSVPYGFGLSYTKFEVSDVYFSTQGDQIQAACCVKNIGERQGDEVIQFYVGFAHSSIDRPLKSLKGFQRVSLKQGETKKVQIRTPIEKLKWFNEKTKSWELEHMEYEMYIGTSSSEKDLIEGKVIL